MAAQPSMTELPGDAYALLTGYQTDDKLRPLMDNPEAAINAFVNRLPCIVGRAELHPSTSADTIQKIDIRPVDGAKVISRKHFEIDWKSDKHVYVARPLSGQSITVDGSLER